ncbi:olfactory receptor 7E24-like [Thomomys bottae]
MYLLTVLGNLLIILAVTSDPHLHIPMYFFLSNLSLIDIGFTPNTVPKLLMNLQSQNRAISYGGCLTQMSLFITFACADSMILIAMAYDRFVAICHPLHYSCIMNPHLCVSLLWVSFTLGLLESLLHNLIVLQLTCFRTVDIANFFCHPSQLLHLACTDSFSNEIVMFLTGILLGVLPASGILFSYCQILSSILKIPSTAGKYKAFSTCGPHLSVVSLFYGTGLGEYFGSALSTSPRNHVVASVMYAVVTPLLKPFIYSLRNRDISRALERFHTRAFSVFAPAASR